MSASNGNRASPQPCEACGARELSVTFQVAGDAGGQGLVPTTDRYGTALADIVRCATCGHMQLERFPDRGELSEGYAEAASDAYVAEEAGQRETARRTLAAIERHVAPGQLLDLGCWVGFLVAEAADRGWHAIGVEPSEFASEYARERLGLDVRTAEILDAELPERHFDAIYLGDVIEHLPRAGDALDRIASLLTPRGVVALALPDAGSLVARLLGPRWWSVLPTHVHYFSRHSLRVLLARHGFEVLEARTAPKSFTVRYYVERLAGYNPSVADRLVAAAERVGLAERRWAPDFRDRMLVIARLQGPGELTI